MRFIYFQKLFLFSRCLNFCVDFLAMQEKRLHQKDKINFKTYDVTSKLNQVRYQNMTRQTFFFKNHAENETGRVYKKALHEVKVSDLQLNFNAFRQSSTWHTRKHNCLKIQTINPETGSILSFQKIMWEYYMHHILCIVFRKKFHCLIALLLEILVNMCIATVNQIVT